MKGTIVFWVILMLVGLLIVVLLILTAFIIEYISQEGLKSVFEAIWEGNK